ncbi:hypothetical protein [Pseudonocardia yunnanensis]|uniref:Uncharacterized protein n=1 Tax=Pseudonocardia yunnanensis TaxID=58107 RepID=A0ABW4F0L8_9PSEU
MDDPRGATSAGVVVVRSLAAGLSAGSGRPPARVGEVARRA